MLDSPQVLAGLCRRLSVPIPPVEVRVRVRVTVRVAVAVTVTVHGCGYGYGLSEIDEDRTNSSNVFPTAAFVAGNGMSRRCAHVWTGPVVQKHQRKIDEIPRL